MLAMSLAKAAMNKLKNPTVRKVTFVSVVVITGLILLYDFVIRDKL